MCESIFEWIKFWLGCIHDGLEVGDCLFGFSDLALVILVGWLTYKKRHELSKYWEDKSVKWAWRILGVAFVTSTIFVAPFLKFQEADKRKTTQEKFDYINLNRPYLDAQLEVDSTNSNSTSYHYEVQNTGKLPAQITLQEQKSPYFTVPEFQAHSNYLVPGGHMQISSDPAFTEKNFPVDLYLVYNASYEETNLTFNDVFHFRNVRTPGLHKQEMDMPGLNLDPVKGTNTPFSFLEETLNLPVGAFSFWQKGGHVFASSSNRLFLYDLVSKIAIFKSTTNGKPIVLSLEIPDKTNGSNDWHFIAFQWNPTGTFLEIDSNQVFENWP